jgi:hypothetical protein
MAKTRAGIMSASVDREHRESSAPISRQSRRSAIASSMTPPSDVSRPPSKAAVIYLGETAGNENVRRLLSIMAGGALRCGEWVGVSNQILRYVIVFQARQPQIEGVMNKMG